MPTSYGLSEHTNWYDIIAPVFGIGQGAFNGPPGWGTIINIVLKVYTKLAKGCTIKHIQNQGVVSLKTNADTFVDEATLLHNNHKFNASAQELMTQVKHDASIWSRLLWVTGGLLEFKKSSYFLMIWNFTEDGEPNIVEEADLPENNVQLIDASGNSTKPKMLRTQQRHQDARLTQSSNISKKHRV
eukprot:7098522-Ditylum_brightwellii.AAC.1